MNNTLTTLRSAELALSAVWLKGDAFAAMVNKPLAGLRALIASMEAQPEPVLYQYRWLNPNNNPDDVCLMDWKLLEPRNPYMGTVQDRIDELEAYRYEGKVVYEVRALYAQPSEPKAEPLITVEASLRFRLDCEQSKSRWLEEEVMELKEKLNAQPKAEPARLTEDQIKCEFGKLYPGDLPLIELAANNRDFVLESIGARHHWAAFKAGARAIESKIRGDV